MYVELHATLYPTFPKTLTRQFQCSNQYKMWKAWLELHTGCQLHGRQVTTKLQRTSLSSPSAQARTTPLKRVHLRDGNADLVMVKKPARTFVSLPNSERARQACTNPKFITGDKCIRQGRARIVEIEWFFISNAAQCTQGRQTPAKSRSVSHATKGNIIPLNLRWSLEQESNS
jgi:hypothetical protein